MINRLAERMHREYVQKLIPAAFGAETGLRLDWMTCREVLPDDHTAIMEDMNGVRIPVRYGLFPPQVDRVYPVYQTEQGDMWVKSVGGNWLKNLYRTTHLRAGGYQPDFDSMFRKFHCAALVDGVLSELLIHVDLAAQFGDPDVFKLLQVNGVDHSPSAPDPNDRWVGPSSGYADNEPMLIRAAAAHTRNLFYLISETQKYDEEFNFLGYEYRLWRSDVNEPWKFEDRGPIPFSYLLSNIVFGGIAVDPSSSTTVYVSAQVSNGPPSYAPHHEIWKTSDAGQTWTRLTDINTAVTASALMVPRHLLVLRPGEILSVAFRFDTARNSFHYSTDDGASWTEAARSSDENRPKPPPLLSDWTDTGGVPLAWQNGEWLWPPPPDWRHDLPAPIGGYPNPYDFYLADGATENVSLDRLLIEIGPAFVDRASTGIRYAALGGLSFLNVDALADVGAQKWQQSVQPFILPGQLHCVNSFYDPYLYNPNPNATPPKPQPPYVPKAYVGYAETPFDYLKIHTYNDAYVTTPSNYSGPAAPDFRCLCASVRNGRFFIGAVEGVYRIDRTLYSDGAFSFIGYPGFSVDLLTPGLAPPGDTLYAASRAGSFARSVDGGATWTTGGTIPTARSIELIAEIYPGQLLAVAMERQLQQTRTMYDPDLREPVPLDGYVHWFFSDNAGATWRRIYTPNDLVSEYAVSPISSIPESQQADTACIPGATTNLEVTAKVNAAASGSTRPAKTGEADGFLFIETVYLGSGDFMATDTLDLGSDPCQLKWVMQHRHRAQQDLDPYNIVKFAMKYH